MRERAGLPRAERQVRRVGCRKMSEKSGSRAAATERQREGLPKFEPQERTERELPGPRTRLATAGQPPRATSQRGGAKASAWEAPQPGLRRAKRRVGQTEAGAHDSGPSRNGHLREEAGFGTAWPAPRHTLPPWVGTLSHTNTRLRAKGHKFSAIAAHHLGTNGHLREEAEFGTA